MIRPIQCEDCGKQRWEPQVPEAYTGWHRFGSGDWKCPQCIHKMGEALLSDLERRIGGMCEGDVDAFIADMNAYPDEDDKRLKAACFRRLAELREASS